MCGPRQLRTVDTDAWKDKQHLFMTLKAIIGTWNGKVDQGKFNYITHTDELCSHIAERLCDTYKVT